MCHEKWCKPLLGRRRLISYATLPDLSMKATSTSVRTRSTAPSPAAGSPGDSLPFSRLRASMRFRACGHASSRSRRTDPTSLTGDSTDGRERDKMRQRNSRLCRKYGLKGKRERKG